MMTMASPNGAILIKPGAAPLASKPQRGDINKAKGSAPGFHLFLFHFVVPTQYGNVEMTKNTKCNLVKLSLLTLLLSLIACSENGPTNANNVSVASNDTGKLRLEVSTSTLISWGEVSEIKMTVGNTLELIATLEDQNGDSILNQPLFISSENGNFFTETNLLTDNYGQITTLLVAAALGKDTITITNKAGLSTALSITVNNNPTENTDPLEELPGVVSWKTLAKVTLKNEVPSFHQEIDALNGKKVKVQGFMMPLEQTEKQQHFLLSSNPPTCSFCLPAGSEGLIEVYAKDGIETTFDPIIISGTLNVLKNDEMGLYYRMQNAVQITR